jgi:hypothetical protein
MFLEIFLEKYHLYMFTKILTVHHVVLQNEFIYMQFLQY